MAIDEFEIMTRAKRGLVMVRELKAHPHRIAGFLLANEQDTVVITSEKQMTEKINVNELRMNDRYSNGSFFMDESESGKVIGIGKLLMEPVKLTINASEASSKQ
jgi:topoisomerase-4 subunit A